MSKLVNNVPQLLNELSKDKFTALEKVGLEAEKNAKLNLTNFPRVDTGRLRNSVSHAIGGSDTVYIGTNVEYAPHVEYGTQKMSASHFLKNAVTEHLDEYERMFREQLKK